MTSRSVRGSRALVRRVLTLGTLAGVSALAISSVGTAQPQASPDRAAGRGAPGRVLDQKLDEPLALSGVSAADLLGGAATQGGGRVIVWLNGESGAQAYAKGRDEAKAKQAAKAQQDAFLSRVRAIDSSARVLARVQVVLNAVFIEVDASKLPEIARDPAVVRIDRIGNYELDLSETVPYIGAKAVQDAGVTGKGIKVGVLDSGIDYTHRALGGSGNVADFTGNNPNIVEPGTFPTAKVVGGFDFVGGAWTGGTGGPAEAPDPDPLDAGTGRGHGTHVGHIIAGTGGVAPGADLYAVKVCSSITTSCSGLALIEGMEFVADPNGDGKVKDRLDLVNMSLGSDYGQPFDDDLSAAVDAASGLGILTVASAGNGSDKPYVAGTPAAAATALSVAQTQVPSAKLQVFVVNGVNHPAVFQSWSAPLTSTITAPVQFGNGAGGATLGCSTGSDPNAVTPGTEPYPAGSLAGKIVLVNRGTCNFSVKVFNIQRGGGLAGIIGLVDTSAPFDGSFGAGGPFTIPGFMISLASVNAIRAAITGGGATGTLNPANTIPLVGQMVGSSSRGPQHENTELIKPEIGAPGASVSALAGSGTGEGPFGGTSGAAPMVTGSAALLLEGFGGTKTTGKGTPSGNAIGHGLSPAEVKALLMNNAETNIQTDPFTGLAPITRIGGGEVRVNRALDAPVGAWDDSVPTGALGFGFVDVDGTATFTKTVRIRNYENTARTYTITPSFRFGDDAANGAVTLTAPAKVDVKPGRGHDTFFDVTMTIDGSKLRGNLMNSGSNGAAPAGLTTNEYDGYLTLADASDTLTIPWHVLPRKAAKVVPSTTTVTPGGFPQTIGLDNQGVGTAQDDGYALLATSPDQPEGARGGQSPTPDLRAVGVNTFPVPAGFCSGRVSFIWAFAISTWERQEHLLPVSHQVSLDVDQNGTPDYVVLNRDASGLGTITDGRQLTWAVNLATGAATASFFAEHATNTGNTVLYVCGEQIGMSGPDLLTNTVDMSVLAQDFYYGGPGDEIDDLTVTPLGERFIDFDGSDDVPGKTNDPDALTIFDFGPFPGNTPEHGLMLFTNGDRGAGNRGGATKATEALLFQTP
jgi:subtilisin family serine protease